jgi:hypothetical protein
MGGGAEAAGDAVRVPLSSAKYPESTTHILDARASGHSEVLTISRSSAPANRRASLGGKDKIPGLDLDEYPPAMFAEGGVGASVRPMVRSDNRGAGAVIGNTLRPYPDGTKVVIDIQ